MVRASTVEVASRLKRSGAVGLGLASSGFFLFLVLQKADLGQAWSQLATASLWEVILAAFVIQFVFLAQAFRWRILVGSKRRVTGFLALVLAGVATNSLLPLRVGDVLRARWLASRERIPSGRALASVFRGGAADFAALMVLLVATFPLVGRSSWASWLAVAGLAALVVVASIIGGAVWYTRRRPRNRLASRGSVRVLVRDLLDELSSTLGPARVASVLLLSVAVWGVWAASALLVCHSLDISVSIPEVLFVTAVMNLGVAIPSSPGFVGTYQWLAVSALGLMGIAPDPALAFALLMQLIWFVPTAIVGGGLALREAHADTVRRRSQRISNR